MQGLYLVTMLWIMSKRHLCLFPVCFLGWEKGERSRAFSSMAPVCKCLKAIEAVSSKTQSLAEQPTCWFRTRARESGLDIFQCWSPALSASALKEKIAEAPLFFGSYRGNLVNTDVLFSETPSSAQNFLPPEWNVGEAWLRCSRALRAGELQCSLAVSLRLWLRSNTLFPLTPAEMRKTWACSEQTGMEHEQWASIRCIFRGAGAGQRQYPSLICCGLGL